MNEKRNCCKVVTTYRCTAVSCDDCSFFKRNTTSDYFHACDWFGDGRCINDKAIDDAKERSHDREPNEPD